MQLKNLIVTLVLSVMAMGGAHACDFSWQHAGDEAVKSMVDDEIGNHVSDRYCAKFNARNELFIQSSSYTLPNMVAGHAIVGIRPRNSKALPFMTYTMLSTDAALRAPADAQKLALKATLLALDNMMSHLDGYKLSE